MFVQKAAVTHLRRGLPQQLGAKKLSSFGISTSQQMSEQTENAQKHNFAIEEDWQQAKDYNSIPGPSRLGLIREFLPGGELHNANHIELGRIMRKRYGDIYRFKGMFGKADVVVTYNPKDIELTFRNEGLWPIKAGMDCFTYYRKKKRPDLFKGVGGLISEQGKDWGAVRTKVNPILMKLASVRTTQNVALIDQISSEFVARLDSLRDPGTNALTNSFKDELNLWAFESIASIALNTRMGLLTDQPDPNARKLLDNMADMFQFCYEYEIMPSFWRYYETAGFKRMMQTFDNIAEIIVNYIDVATKKFEAEANPEPISVLEKLCHIDRHVAFVMAMDMLMSGADTTTSAFTTTLYLLAKHPEKQAALRQELSAIMPEPETPLTAENTQNMPYLRACIKEALRIMPVTPGNYRKAGKDLVLSGYKVPKHTGVLMNVMFLANNDAYFPRSAEFLPERWLRSGPDACPAAKSTNPFVYQPFGFGPRICVGKRVSELEIETLMAKLVRKYKISWAEKEDLQYLSNLISVPCGKINFNFEPV